jgi:hypothetical protein
MPLFGGCRRYSSGGYTGGFIYQIARTYLNELVYVVTSGDYFYGILAEIGYDYIKVISVGCNKVPYVNIIPIYQIESITKV